MTEQSITPREIKFRVWDKATKQMSPPFALFGEFTLLGAVHAWQQENGNPAESSLEALADLVELQFTGLNDRNGKEIYEGDIVQWGIARCEVVFHAGTFCFKRLWKINSHKTWLSGVVRQTTISQFTRSVIIGNVFENPQLAKQPELECSPLNQ